MTKDVESLIEKELRYAEAEFYYIKRLENEVSEKNLSKVRSLVRTLGRIERRLNKSHKKVKSAINTIKKTGKGSEKLDIIETKLDVFEKEGIKSLSKQAGILPKLVKKDEPDWEEIAKEVVKIKKVIIALAELEKELLNEVTQQQLPNEDPNQEVYLQGRNSLKLNKYIERGKIQTELLKSIPYFKYWYEKTPNVLYKVGIFGDAWTWSTSSSKLLEAMHKEAHKLYTVFTEEELEKLLRVRSIPPRATILIFEQLRIPIVAYNLEYLPQNVQGWVSHSMPGENLEIIAREESICYNIEVLRRRKTIVSYRYEIDPAEKRIREGVSLAYQSIGKYLSYATSIGNRIRGGTWVFSITSVLTGNLILDFRDTVDGIPEIVLRTKNYYEEDSTILKILEKAIQMIIELEKIVPIKTKIYLNEEIPEKTRKNFQKRALFPFAVPSSETYKEWKVQTGGSEGFFGYLTYYPERGLISPQEMIPSFFTFAKGKEPRYLDTTFLRDMNRYHIPEENSSNTLAQYLILQLLFDDTTKKDVRTYAEILLKLSPKDVERLVKRTKQSLIQALNKIIDISHKRITPACIDITKGVLLLDMEYHDEKTLQRLIDKKIPVFTLLPDFRDTTTIEFLDWFVSEVLEFQKRKEKVSINDYFSKEGNEVILRTE